VYNYSMNEEELRTQLQGLPIADVRWYPQVDSTNAIALEWAANGAADGCLVAADQQSAGRGRLGRKWVTNPGAALAFSLILRPTPGERKHIELFSPLGSVGVADALSGLGLQPQIKWPNDVLLERLKVCGILVESVWMGQELDALVMGIGVNVAPLSVPPPEELLFPAVCVETVLGKPVDRLALLSEILASIFEWRYRLDSVEFMHAWQSRLAFVGEKVSVSRPAAEPLEGLLLGVDAGGGLRLRLQDGIVVKVLVGDVSLRPHA
jgi:BirA family transcriptional regulator, biotin operon repressor / biotin---[acetyl-CoA-carboxylase] ligase